MKVKLQVVYLVTTRCGNTRITASYAEAASYARSRRHNVVKTLLTRQLCDFCARFTKIKRDGNVLTGKEGDQLIACVIPESLIFKIDLLPGRKPRAPKKGASAARRGLKINPEICKDRPVLHTSVSEVGGVIGLTEITRRLGVVSSLGMIASDRRAVYAAIKGV